MALQNARYDQLPSGIPIPTDIMTFRDQVQGITKRFPANLVISSSVNIEWVSTTNYPVNAIVSRDGDLWKSLQTPNQGKTPGQFPLYWQKITRGINWEFWAASTYIETNVFVFYNLDGETHIMQLVSGTRPYTSTNFLAEFAAGDWVSLTQNVILQNAVQGAGTLSINMDYLKKRMFQTDVDIAEPKTWSILNGGNALEFVVNFGLADLYAQTFPASIRLMNSDNANWDGVNRIWTPYNAGEYKMEGHRKGNNYLVKIFGPGE
jgi:hypothetical protein